jgi:hypothetical protein
VARGEPNGVWALDYLLKDQKDVHLRVTTIGPEGSELAVAKGRPPQGNKSYEMTWAILRQSGREPLDSQFLTVLEPFEGERLVRKIEPLELSGPTAGDFEPIGVRITTGDFVDMLVFQSDGAGECTADGLTTDGEFAFWRERNGKCEAAVLAGGTSLRGRDAQITLPEAAYRGRIESCDWENRTLVIEPKPEDVTALVGQHVQIHNDRGSHASYRIQAAEPVKGGCRVTLPLDPRIGEGFVAKCEEGRLTSATRLRFYNYWGYYAGKTIANEDASVAYRLSDVTGAVNCMLDPSAQGKIAAERLQAEFADKDGDGRPRFVIYDYGPGDQVTVKRSAARGL